VKLELPIVRPRDLPEGPDDLQWSEGPDLPSVAVVMLAGAVGGWMGMGNLAGGASGDQATVGWVFVILGSLLIVAAVMELVRFERVSISAGKVTATRRQVMGRTAWSAPLAEFRGVAYEERGRRLFVRNQGLPATGRRGPVTEFVLVLRHQVDGERNLDLFRAQPSLSVLRNMHAVRASKGGPDVVECERVARGYRDALANLCSWLDKPALIDTGGGAETEVSPGDLNLWLEVDSPSVVPPEA
jgi:hypothetical protein